MVEADLAVEEDRVEVVVGQPTRLAGHRDAWGAVGVDDAVGVLGVGVGVRVRAGVGIRVRARKKGHGQL